MGKHSTSLKQFDEIFVDGSAYQNKKLYGIGGIVICYNNLSHCTQFKTQLFGKHTSETAEIYSVVHALNSLPENSRVVVHNDLKKLCHKINGGVARVREWLDKETSKGKKPVAKACKDLFNAIARHDTVVAVLESKSSRSFMKASHDLAQEGATGKMQIAPIENPIAQNSPSATEAPETKARSPHADLESNMGYASFQVRKRHKGSRARQIQVAIDISISANANDNPEPE